MIKFLIKIHNVAKNERGCVYLLANVYWKKDNRKINLTAESHDH